MKFAVVLCIFAALYTGTVAHVVIDIDPEEMQRIAEILVENYLTHNLTPLPRPTVFIQFKKVTVYVLKLVGITISLVSANLLSSMFEPAISSHPTIISNNISSVAPVQLCDRDFGCVHNVCWRACDASVDVQHGENRTRTWCWSSPNAETHGFQQCIYAHDCSPCWECLGQCHSRKLKWYVITNAYAHLFFFLTNTNAHFFFLFFLFRCRNIP